MGKTPRHSSLLTVTMVLKGGIRAEAVIDTAASGPIEDAKLAMKIGTLTRRTKARIAASSTFDLDAEVINIGPREMILRLSWLQERRRLIMILDVISRYANFAELWSSNKLNLLPQYGEVNPTTQPRNRPLYKTTWEEDEALRAYMAEHQPVGKVHK